MNAFHRGTFSLSVNPTPLADVHALGTPGLVQEFASLTNSKVILALVKPDPNAPASQNDTLQVSSDLYTFYNSVGVDTAGYPVNDTTICPLNTLGICSYQLFTRNYGLFVYSSPPIPGIIVKDPFFTEWEKLGGVTGAPGAATSAETTVTSPSKVQALQQTFGGAAIYAYPPGSSSPAVYSVSGASYSLFLNAGGLPIVGLPTSTPLTSPATNLTRQTFEYGRIEMSAGNQPNLLFNLAEVDINNVTLPLNLSQGATATISASTWDLRGSLVTGRTLTWSSTNGAVVKVTGSGYNATVQGVGGGVANVYVSSEGKTSPPLTVKVSSVCCAVGEGAPAGAISQAFQDAVARNRLQLVLPTGSPVVRAGAGYVQTFTAADGSGTGVAIAQGDKSAVAYALQGDLYRAYATTGGFTGSLGYPASDPLPGGVQKFLSGAALAGSPVRVIPASIATKWFQLGWVSGTAGSPVQDAAAFQSVSGAAGFSQAFSGGFIYGLSSGQAFFSGGPILSRYLALSGPSGGLGAPASDIFLSGAVLVQNFESGYIDLQPGAVAAVEHFNPRHPAVSATPASVAPGGRVHISATGFTPGATLSATLTGQPGFSLVSAAGAYAWDILIPPDAKAATVSVQVADRSRSDLASASYSITPLPFLLPKLTLVSGDRQTGAPGSTLALPLTLRLQDSTGTPIAGVPVGWTISPGARLQSTFVTDENGQLSATLRLPPAAGVAVGSFSAGGQVVAFSALVSAVSVASFPSFTQADSQGGLTAALAALLRYHQNAGFLPAPNGLASPSALTQYLKANEGYFLSDSGNAIPNPWIAAQFAGSDLVIEDPNADHVRDVAATGTPLLLLLSLKVNGTDAGSAAVNAAGVNADASIAISDPNPSFARASLNDYLSGFSTQGATVQGTVAAALRLVPHQVTPGASPFSAVSPAGQTSALGSPAGNCPSIEVTAQTAPAPPTTPPAGARFHYCDGSQPNYELDLSASRSASLIDLPYAAPFTAFTLPANGTLAWRIGRNGGTLVAAPQTVAVDTVLDSASFRAALAPGGLATLFGQGFGPSTSVVIGGKPATVIAAFPFQLNFLIPPATAPGTVSLQVAGSTGTAEKSLALVAAAPGIFTISATAGAIVNVTDGKINGPASPVQRGEYISVYCTGLGITAVRNGFQTVVAPVSARINGTVLPVSFAGLLPNFSGLYQVNVLIPPTLAPTLSGSLEIVEGATVSNEVPLAIQ